MITLRNLSLQRGIKILLQEVNLTLHAGQKIGFIGANGCGKSSLFALLRGELQADSGELTLPSQLTIAHVAQETPAIEQAAIDYVLDGDTELREVEHALQQAEHMHDGLRQAELHAQFDAIGGYTAPARAAQLLHGLGFKIGEEQRRVCEYSGGWRVRLNLARALMCRSDILLLDEPTNHLDLDAVLWFEQWLKHYQGTLLLISHDRDFLDNVVDNIAHIYQQTITLYAGNYAAFEKQRAEKLALQQASYEKQQKEIAHIQDFINRFRYKATKAKQAQSRIKALEKMEMIAPAHVDSPFHFTFPEPEKMPAILVDLEKVSMGYNDTPILEKINLKIIANSRLGLLGENGAGKSTFIKLLSNTLPTLSGVMTINDGVKIGYFAQHQLEQLRANESPLEHLQQIEKQATEQILRNFLGGFNFQDDMATTPIATFSGGEKARLALALLIWQKPNLLLLDEPTNHLDLEMRHALTTALQDYTGALVVVSHDRHLLRTTTDDLLLVAKGKVTHFEGDLNDYRQWLLTSKNEDQQPTDNKDKQQVVKKQLSAEQRAQRKTLQNRLKNLEKELDKLSVQKQEIERQLAQPDVYENSAEVQLYITQQTKIADQLAQVEEEWLVVTESLESLDID